MSGPAPAPPPSGARPPLVGFDNAHPVARQKRGERGRITPKVMHDRVELDLQLTHSREAS